MHARPVVPVEPTRPFFVVGVPRSGTTLLRFMLDSHSRLAVPDESDFIVTLRARRLHVRHQPDLALEAILQHPRFKLWELDPDAVRMQVAKDGPVDFAGVVRTVFSAYAHSRRKARWGDKTPEHVLHMAMLARLFPDAQFVHIIRDGREVAAAGADYRWVPTAVSAGYWWRKRVVKAGRVGSRLGADRYLEVRLEQLIVDPEAVLTQICDFLEEQYEPAMLDYPTAVQFRDSRKLFLQRDHRHLVLPPTAGLRDWRAGLSARQQRLVEAACGPPLRHLGYLSNGQATMLDRAQALIIRLRDIATFSVPKKARSWMHPTTRRIT